MEKSGDARVIAVSSRAQRLGDVNFKDPNFEKTEYDIVNKLNLIKLLNITKKDSLKGYGVCPWAIDPHYAKKLWY